MAGTNSRKLRGLKDKKQDLSANIFELRVDCGLFSQKGRDSLANGLG
jgi:hypothetical protein